MNKEKRFQMLLDMGNITTLDVERAAMFCIFAANQVLFNRINEIYDFKNDSIIFEAAESSKFSSSERQLIRLGFNLYNSNVQADVFESFYNLDAGAFESAIIALKIRFSI